MKLVKLLSMLFVFALVFTVASPVFALAPVSVGAPTLSVQEDTPPLIENFEVITQVIIAIVTALVVFGLKFALKEYGLDFTGRTTQIVALIVDLTFQAINQLLALVPPQFYGVTVSALGVVTSLLMAFGVAGLIKNRLGPSKR